VEQITADAPVSVEQVQVPRPVEQIGERRGSTPADQIIEQIVERVEVSCPARQIVERRGSVPADQIVGRVIQVPLVQAPCRVQVPVCVKVPVPSDVKSTFADTGAFFAADPADTVTTFDFASEGPDYYDHYVTASNQSSDNQSVCESGASIVQAPCQVQVPAQLGVDGLLLNSLAYADAAPTAHDVDTDAAPTTAASGLQVLGPVPPPGSYADPADRTVVPIVPLVPIASDVNESDCAPDASATQSDATTAQDHCTPYGHDNPLELSRRDLEARVLAELAARPVLSLAEEEANRLAALHGLDLPFCPVHCQPACGCYGAVSRDDTPTPRRRRRRKC